jgi:SRSO17 transposase
MLERAFRAGVPHGWITADETYGGDGALRRWLEAERQAYVLAVRANEYVWTWSEAEAPRQVTVGELAQAIPEAAWTRLSCGDGAKGPRLYDWAWGRLPHPADARDGWTRWVLVRRSLSDAHELSYYLVFGLADASLEQVVRVAGRRWTIEVGLEQTKGEVGLDQYEVRRWGGWYRHITLALLAHAFLAVTRAHARAADDEKGGWLEP